MFVSTMKVLAVSVLDEGDWWGAGYCLELCLTTYAEPRGFVAWPCQPPTMDLSLQALTIPLYSDECDVEFIIRYGPSAAKQHGLCDPRGLGP